MPALPGADVVGVPSVRDKLGHFVSDEMSTITMATMLPTMAPPLNAALGAGPVLLAGACVFRRP